MRRGTNGSVVALVIAMTVGGLAHTAGAADGGWKTTQKGLRNLATDTALMSRLAMAHQTIELALRKGSIERTRVVRGRAVHLGYTDFSMTVSEPIEWQEKLMLTPRGLEVFVYSRGLTVKQSSIEAIQEDLDAQMAMEGKTYNKSPSVTVEYDEGAFVLTAVRQVKLGAFGGVRLEASEWGHVTEGSLEASVRKFYQNEPEPRLVAASQ